jgi:hypothetical protein
MTNQWVNTQKIMWYVCNIGRIIITCFTGKPIPFLRFRNCKMTISHSNIDMCTCHDVLHNYCTQSHTNIDMCNGNDLLHNYCTQSHTNSDVPNGDYLLHTIPCKHWCAQWGQFIAHNPMQTLMCPMGMIYCTFIAHFTTNQH